MIRFVSIRQVVVATALSSCLAAAALADANPMYTAWAKCKPGATVKMKANTEAMGQKTNSTITTKLLEVTPEKAVVEIKMSLEMMGQKMDQPAQKQDIPAEIKAPEAGKPEGDMAAKMAQAMKDAKKGEETIEVAGKSYKCTTMEFATEQNGMKIMSKTWVTPEVPGGTVKTESNTSGSMTSKTTTEVVEFSDAK